MGVMAEKIRDTQPPRGLARLAFRFPIWLYRARLGGLLGERFVLLTHTGRKSGLPRQTVLEVVRYDRSTGSCVVASGWGTKSDWVQNVTANPKIVMQVRSRRTAAVAERLFPEAAADELVDYARRHPEAARLLARFMGYRLDGTPEDVHDLGRKLPMFIFKPIADR